MTERESFHATSTDATRNVTVLVLCQALAMTGSSLVITMAALAGRMLADDPALATLPIAVQFASTMLSTIPASLLMGRVGRRVGFSVGQMIGAVGGGIAAYALYTGDFWLFTVAGALLGCHNAFWQYYRFAAADTASAAFRGRAISYVMAGGVFAAVAGPQLAKWTSGLFEPVLFAGGYLTLCVLNVLAILLLQGLRIPTPLRGGGGRGRPLVIIARQPVFIVAVLASMTGYAVMNLMMTATPLAMVFCGFTFNDSATVIQFHVLAMFAPSFFTGGLIARFGELRIIVAGGVLIFGAVLINISGVAFGNFSAALTVLGLGWNFMFIGGSTLLAQAHSTEEQARTQAMHDFMVFTLVACSAFSSGWLNEHVGWAALNMVAAAPLAVAMIAAIWFMQARRAAA